MALRSCLFGILQTTYIAGGKLRARGNCWDALAIDFVRKMNFDLNFITGAGFSAKSGRVDVIVAEQEEHEEQTPRDL